MKGHWTEVAEDFRRLAAFIDRPGGPADFTTCAKAFARAANGYYAAVVKDGGTSMRLQAVCKALDLKTKKSALSRFLGEPEAG